MINKGEPWNGRDRVRDMAAGFYAEVPDLTLTCDDLRMAGDHVVYVWTFTGHDAATGNALDVIGWAEWEMDEDLKVAASHGWFNAEDLARQASGA